MTKNQSLVIQGAVLLGVLCVSAYMNARLPQVVPTHWDINNRPNAYGSKALDLWLMPAVMAFIMLLTIALPAISPRNFSIERFSSTFNYAMALVGCMMGAMHLMVLRAASEGTLDFGRWMMLVLFLFFAAFGNVLGRTKKNFFIGVRTPWTLADERVWDRTHREAGKMWLLGGLFGAICALLAAPFFVSITVLMVLALLPILRSYYWYRVIVK